MVPNLTKGKEKKSSGHKPGTDKWTHGTEEHLELILGNKKKRRVFRKKKGENLRSSDIN